ncbi:MAG: hypothetical protein AB1921_07315 [Thermodesulfobacteriota bacterium]
MRLPKLLIPVLLAALACAACASPSRYAARAQEPALDFSRYGFNPETTLASRVAEPPDFVLDYLKKMDERPGYAPHTLSPQEREMVEHKLELLPRGYQEILRERLLGLYFVDDFLGSGYTEFVPDGQGRVFSFMVINSDALNAPLSDWLTQKENTAFSQDTDRVKVEVDCGADAPALPWVLLHEATHVADYAENFTPYVEPAVWELQGKPKRSSAFTKGIWVSYAVPRREIKWPYSGNVRFYGLGKGPGLALSRAPEVYQALSRTPFASLYASQNWAEDLAEAMTLYHMFKEMGAPLAIRVFQDGKPVCTFQPFAGAEDLRAKRNLPEKLL